MCWLTTWLTILGASWTVLTWVASANLCGPSCICGWLGGWLRLADLGRLACTPGKWHAAACSNRGVWVIHLYKRFPCLLHLAVVVGVPMGSKEANPSVQALVKPLFASLLLIFCWLKWVLKPAQSLHWKAFPKGVGRGRGIAWVHFLQSTIASILKSRSLGPVEKQSLVTLDLLCPIALTGRPVAECHHPHLRQNAHLLHSSSACCIIRSAPTDIYIYGRTARKVPRINS